MIEVTMDRGQQAEMLKNLEKLADFDPIATKQMESAMHVAVKMGEVKVIAELRAMAEINRSEMMSQVGGNFTPLAPVNPKVAANRIRGIVEVQGGPMNIVGLIGDRTQTYLRLVEAGRGPGKHPPAGALQDWAENVLGVTPGPSRTTKKGRVIRDVSVGRALSRAIAAKGIRPSPVLRKAEEAIHGHVMELFDQALLKVAAELGFK